LTSLLTSHKCQRQRVVPGRAGPSPSPASFLRFSLASSSLSRRPRPPKHSRKETDLSPKPRLPAAISTRARLKHRSKRKREARERARIREREARKKAGEGASEEATRKRESERDKRPIWSPARFVSSAARLLPHYLPSSPLAFPPRHPLRRRSPVAFTARASVRPSARPPTPRWLPYCPVVTRGRSRSLLGLSEFVVC
jgi:hypothetical protein